MKRMFTPNSLCLAEQHGSSTGVPLPLKKDYFKPEPRNTAYWLTQIKSWCQQETVKNGKALLPNIDTERLAAYIENPADTIAQGLLSDEELQQLQAPQHLVLFYFLRKIAASESVNQKVTSDFKDKIAQQILGYQRSIATAQQGIAYIDAEDVTTTVDLPAGANMTAFVEGSEKSLQFDLQQQVRCFPVKLVKLLSVQHWSGAKETSTPKSSLPRLVNDYPLPLKQEKIGLTPFRPIAADNTRGAEHCPALALSSPLLELGAGQRHITLSLALPEGGVDISDISYEVSTASGWHRCQPVNKEPGLCGDKLAPTFVFKFTPQFPAITALAKPAPRHFFAKEQACMLITFKKAGFDSSKVRIQSLNVEVSGLRPTAVRNQDGVLLPENSLELFGSDAPLGATFSFCHPELACKPLETIQFTPHWLGKPADLTEYYRAYNKQITDFKVACSAVRLNASVPLPVETFIEQQACTQPGLPGDTATPEQAQPEATQQGANHETNEELSAKNSAQNQATELFSGSLSYSLPNRDFTSGNVWQAEQPDPVKQPLYFQLQLNGQDFGSQEYPLLMANYAIAKVGNNQPTDSHNGLTEAKQGQPTDIKNELTEAKQGQKNDGSNEPTEAEKRLGILSPVNMPYIPKISGIDIHYTASVDAAQPGDLVQIYNIGPLGYCAQDEENQHKVVKESDCINCCALYFGFERLLPGEDSSLFFKGIPGDSDLPPYELQWQYLSDAGWQSLSDYILQDDTDGLCQAGLLRWKTPDNITSDNSLMPSGIHWFRVVPAIPNNTKQDDWRALMAIQVIKPNGVYVTRNHQDLEEADKPINVPDDTPLNLAEPPMVLYGFDTLREGYPAESQEQYWARVFNKVRYRGRPATPYDYEYLIMENFDNVRQVMCLPTSLQIETATPVDNGQRRPVVNAVIVEKVQALHQPFPLKPKASRRLLNAIHRSVTEKSSPFLGQDDCHPVRFQAINPVYRDIGFKIVVQFSGDRTDAENQRQLSTALSDYINPWVNSKEQPLKFGCWFSFGEIIAHLQSLSFVQVILALKLNIADGAKLYPPEEYAFRPHEVAIFSESLSTIVVENNLQGYTANQFYGIGAMALNTDFYVQ